MTDREEREEHIKRLEAVLACEEKQSSGKCSKQTCDDNCALLYEQGNWGEWKETLRYAINSLKTDLKYDLLYEETSGQADKNDLGVTSGLEKNSKKLEKDFGESDCISRQATVKRLCKLAEFLNEHKENSGAPYIVAALFIQDNKTEFPPVTPQEPKSEWEHDHEILRAYADGANNVLDKIREQMKDYLRGVEITLEVLVEGDPLRPKMEGAKDTLEECLELIDRAESEA